MVKIMKIGAYSPYLLKHFGGGEKHFLTSLWYLSQKNKVEALISPETSPELLSKAIEKYQRLFNLDLIRGRWVKRRWPPAAASAAHSHHTKLPGN